MLPRVKNIRFSARWPATGLLVLLIFFSAISAASQSVALLAPDDKAESREFAGQIAETLEKRFMILDSDLARSAYLSVSPATPFNLTTAESRLIGETIGCNFFLIVRAETQRRSAFQRAEYYESHLAVWVVSSRTGRLVSWKMQNAEAQKRDIATTKLRSEVPAIGIEIADIIKGALKAEMDSSNPPLMEEQPDEKNSDNKNFRAAIPFRRIKPEYTVQASLFNIQATVDILVYLNEKGVIERTDIERWAGYGLDESVEKNVRGMNWRPAERAGKPVAMKFLVRYNFKKLENKK